ncbi:MAG TPA: radical SAM protein [Gemmata sp.]|nr:radical SAM protein [Gemmata sp.]
MNQFERGRTVVKQRCGVPRQLREAPRLDSDFHPDGVKSRHALLINPFYPKDPHASFGKHVLTPTLALTSFAGATPSEWDLQYWDENLLQGHPPREPFPQVVAITVHLTFSQRAYELARWYRQRGSKVLFGGLHVISCPEECRPHADSLVLGEGAQVWPEVLQDLENGRLKPEYHGSYRRPYTKDPPPRRDLVDRRAFLTTTSVNATRGCHNRCGFCYLATDGLRIPYQCRDVEQVAAEIAADGQPYCVFTDNNLGSRPDYLRELCLRLRSLEIIWSAAVTLDVTDDPSLVRELALAGCTGVFIGFESLTDDNISDARKKSPRTADYARRVRIFHDNGIQVNGSFVLGFDHDRLDCFAKLVDWIEEVRMESATYHILTPYPGTPLFRQMDSEKRILHRDWSRYDTAHVVFRPRHMTPEQLAEGYAYCYERTFSHRCIWHRRPRDWRAVAPYLAMAYLYKKSNWLWPFLIRNRLTHWVWRPLLELSRRRHLRFRHRLASIEEPKADDCPVRLPVYASV